MCVIVHKHNNKINSFIEGKTSPGKKMAELCKLRKKNKNITVELERVIFNTEKFYKQETLFHRRKAKVTNVANSVTIF